MRPTLKTVAFLFLSPAAHRGNRIFTVLWAPGRCAHRKDEELAAGPSDANLRSLALGYAMTAWHVQIQLLPSPSFSTDHSKRGMWQNVPAMFRGVTFSRTFRITGWVQLQPSAGLGFCDTQSNTTVLGESFSNIQLRHTDSPTL